MLPPAWLEEGKVMPKGSQERMKDKCLVAPHHCWAERQSRSGPDSGQGRKWLEQGEAGSIWRNDGKVPSGLGVPRLLRAFYRESCLEGSSPAHTTGGDSYPHWPGHRGPH